VSRQDNNIITSPSYGKIYKIQKKENYICISIILTIFDVHFQYVPCTGYVRKITYDNNGIFNIILNDYNKTRYNEKMIYEIESKNGKIFVYQIAGFFFRRIVPYLKENTYVSKGDKLGLITFGSRVDIFLPSKNFTLNITENQKIKGGQELGYYKI
jgi:phosphatidylserine decarboxylase